LLVSHERALPVSLPGPGRSFCPSCEKKKQLLWAEWLHKEVLEPVPHRHVVLTMPRLLRGIFRKRRELLLDLAQCAAEAIADYMKRQVGAEARPGIVVSIASAGPPWIAARRSESDADGARRLLGCALCGAEWPFGRIRCPCCFEEDPTKLPSFQSGTYPMVRIEACEACLRYVKSIDLTADARAIPEVDDLVSLGMDLWAQEQGYARVAPGLAGI
jgi:formate dehydrogenase maturation protein FdhE